MAESFAKPYAVPNDPYVDANFDAAFRMMRSVIPAGVGPIPFSGSVAPDGWLMCYGQAVSRTVYAALFAVIGTAFGAGDGSTTFNLPDMRGRFPLGKDNMGGTSANRVTATQADNLGQGSGVESHSHTINEHTHSLSSHTHYMNHQHYFGITVGATGGNGVYSGNDSTWAYRAAGLQHTHYGENWTNAANRDYTDGPSNNTSGGASNRGTDSINNMNPYLTTNYIIKF